METVKEYNDKKVPIGKKMIYEMNYAAITTVLKTIRNLIAEGKLVEHMITLPRGTFCSLMIPEKDQPRDDTIRQKIGDMTLYQSKKNGEMLEEIILQNRKIIKLLEERK